MNWPLNNGYSCWDPPNIKDTIIAWKAYISVQPFEDMATVPLYCGLLSISLFSFNFLINFILI